MSPQELHNFVLELQFAEDVSGILAMMDAVGEIGMVPCQPREVSAEEE